MGEKKHVKVVFDTEASNGTLKFLLGNDFHVCLSGKEYGFSIWRARSGGGHSTFLGSLPRTKKDLWFVMFKGKEVWCSKQFSPVIVKLLEKEGIAFKTRKRTYLNKENADNRMLKWFASK